MKKRFLKNKKKQKKLCDSINKAKKGKAVNTIEEITKEVMLGNLKKQEPIDNRLDNLDVINNQI